jgi:peptide/nickel transport system permease protein
VITMFPKKPVLRCSFRFARTWPTRTALCVLIATVFVAIFGPFLTPHSPSDLVGVPYASPAANSLLGTDYIGEDILSRVLSGGRSVIVFAGLATLLAYAVGMPLGLVAGFKRGLTDPLIMRVMDILLAFPALLFLLILATGAGPSVTALVLGIAIVNLPGLARIIRTATLEVSVKGYVEAALARGDATAAILRRQILPNIWGPITADIGPRFTVAILLVAGVNFLGLGVSPPAADWAVMISENQSGLTIQPWAVLVPAIMIALLTVSLNITADAIARSLGRSVDPAELRR